MSAENPFAKKPTSEKDPVTRTAEELAAGASPFRDAQGRETAFSAEGVLNRNFGKDPSIPTQAAVYEGGILNRAKMYEARAEQNAAPQETSGEASIEAPAEASAPSSAVSQPAAERSWAPQAEQPSDKPYLTQLIEHFKATGAQDPEAAALEELKANIDPSITDPRERGAVIVQYLREHREQQGT